MNLGHRFADGIRNVISHITPVPKKSQLTSQGTLNPDEFVEAGDHLAFKFPTWQWQSTDPKYRVNWLPSDKQYLISRNVPCRSRVKDLNDTAEVKDIIIGEDEWIITGEADDEAAQDISLENELNYNSHESHQFSFDQEALRNIQNIEDITDLNVLDDFALMHENEEDPAAASHVAVSEGECHASTRPTRTYDISITYDKYYQTPRVWLFGYDENGRPLEPHQIFEDVDSRYALKSVTVDPHPCTGIPTASIHPCRHSSVMKKVAKSWETRGSELKAHFAIVILLKFVSGVIPTIDYDFTMDIEMIY